MTVKLGRCILSLCIAFLLWPLHTHGLVNKMPALRGIVQDAKKAKDDLYESFRKGATGDSAVRKAAYDAGKEYLKKYADDKDPRSKEIRDWITKYDTDAGAALLVSVYTDKKYAEAFDMAKPVLASDPDNISVLTALGYAGIFTAAAGNSLFNSDAAAYARKAIELIEAGKAQVDWKPFSGKDETLGWLNYSLGMMTVQTEPVDAIRYFSKAASYDGAPKKDPTLYYYLASLHDLDYQKLSADYKAKYEGKPESPESKAALARKSDLISVVIDGYARLIAYIEADVQFQQRYQAQKPAWMDKLTTYYKLQNNGSDNGLKELIANVRSKPLPVP